MKRLFTLFFIVSTFCVWAQRPVEVSDDINEEHFMPYELAIFVDSTNQKSFTEISSRAFADGFRVHKDYQNKDFCNDISYWIRFPIRHTSSTKKVWLLEFYDQTIDYLEAYLPQTDGTYSRIDMGDQMPFAKKNEFTRKISSQ